MKAFPCPRRIYLAVEAWILILHVYLEVWYCAIVRDNCHAWAACSVFVQFAFIVIMAALNPTLLSLSLPVWACPLFTCCTTNNLSSMIRTRPILCLSSSLRHWHVHVKSEGVQVRENALSSNVCKFMFYLLRSPPSAVIPSARVWAWGTQNSRCVCTCNMILFSIL